MFGFCLPGAPVVSGSLHPKPFTAGLNKMCILIAVELSFAQCEQCSCAMMKISYKMLLNEVKIKLLDTVRYLARYKDCT